MNKVILSGNLCQDVELKQSTSGKSVLTNCVAVKRDFKNYNGDYESDFINIAVWNSQAEYLSKYAKKGDRVELCGRWEVRKYTANDGTNRVAHECVVESIKVFSKPTFENSPNTKPSFEEISTEENLPF